MKLSYFFPLLSLLFISCVTTNLEKGKVQPFDKLRLDYNITEIKILDKRSKEILTDEAKIPFISRPKQIRVFYPRISDIHKSIIEKSISDSFKPIRDSSNTVVVVNFLRAEKQFSATSTSETEKAIISIELMLIKSTKRMSAVASEEYFFKSIDAKSKRLEKWRCITCKDRLFSVFSI
ncbi:hypothetical protein CEQ90_20100 [Lewinellaceae bacterium SD302]|nr:hypothetical protein CEQ90_20100 [Lewinellaceae bacterium SD302]